LQAVVERVGVVEQCIRLDAHLQRMVRALHLGEAACEHEYPEAMVYDHQGPGCLHEATVCVHRFEVENQREAVVQACGPHHEAPTWGSDRFPWVEVYDHQGHLPKMAVEQHAGYGHHRPLE
jgi:hypothetical protein